MAKRIQSYEALDDSQICYWKDQDGLWWIYLPSAGAGVLRNHRVTENADGTITVDPSIKLQGQKLRHGYLRAGNWEACADDALETVSNFPAGVSVKNVKVGDRVRGSRISNPQSIFSGTVTAINGNILDVQTDAERGSISRAEQTHVKDARILESGG
jgi:hypothetical protein